VKTNKNDYIDAEAIAEAVTRPSMRFVPIQTDDQLDQQSLHRVREHSRRPILSSSFFACKTAADHTFLFADHPLGTGVGLGRGDSYVSPR
jgi:hypothetical protein